MCDGEQTADVSSEEREEAVQVDSEAINTARVGRPLRVLGLSKEQTRPVDVET